MAEQIAIFVASAAVRSGTFETVRELSNLTRRSMKFKTVFDTYSYFLYANKTILAWADDKKREEEEYMLMKIKDNATDIISIKDVPTPRKSANPLRTKQIIEDYIRQRE